MEELRARYEAAWRSGQGPRIESYLGGVPETGRASLFRELLALDLGLRRERGESPARDEYERRFPDESHLIAAVFPPAAVEAGRQGPDPDPDPTMSGGEADVVFSPLGGCPTVTGSSPKTIGGYTVVRELGKGGQGTVFRVWDPGLQKEFVIKMAHRPMIPDSGEYERFKEEGRILAQLSHPNLVPVHHLGEHEGRPFLVQECVPDGRNLQEYVARQGRPSPREAARLVAELAGAIAYLHGKGIIHQDIKPANVLIDGHGRPRLIDFGLARLRHPWFEDPGSPDGGTVAYMSPEQADGEQGRIGDWTDVFGLGAVLYALLTGRPPYQAESPAVCRRLARKGDITPPRQIERRIPRPLERICLKALAREPERRHRSAAELGRALRRFLRRRRIAIAGTAGLLVVGLLIGVMVASHVLAPPPLPVQILGLSIKHWANSDGGGYIGQGKLGERSFAVAPNDFVQAEAELSEPAYCFLIAFRPDGEDEICDPEEPDHKPRKTRSPRYPPVSKSSEAYILNNGPGLQAFVLVASRAELPSYREWKERHGTPPWHKGLSGKRGVIWFHDGQSIDSYTADAPIGLPSRRDRTKGGTLGGCPDTVKNLADWYRKIPGIDAVEVMAFPVPPASAR